jgi:hypothetical protein
MHDNLPAEIGIPLAIVLWTIYFFQVRKGR